jgi:prepilin-type N-terminal cleavage/methylation domain-containing protein
VEGRKGFTLIEVVLVMAIIAITLGIAGPRIGAGLGTLELRQSEQMVRTGVQAARIRARRADLDCYVVFDNVIRSVSVLAPDMKVVLQQRLPSSVSFVLESPLERIAFDVAPSGIVSGDSVRLRGRNGEVEVPLR